MDLILKNKYKLHNIAEKCTLKDSLDSIAYTMSISIMETDELRKIGIKKGDSIQLFDYEIKGAYAQIFSGVIWDISRNRKTRKISLTCKERSVYLEESEDELLFQESTLTQRMQRIADDWGLTVGLRPDTEINLAKNKFKESLYSILKKGLKETAQKGGKLFRIRMDVNLDLVELGSNINIYKLETIATDITDKESLEGAITQVKVVGKEESNKTSSTKKKSDKKDNSSKSENNESTDTEKKEKELTLSPVVGVFSKDTDKYGTLQKIVQDTENVKDYDSAKKKADSMFNSGEDSISFKSCYDINTLHAGNSISLDGNIYIITELTHEIGNDGEMSGTVMTEELVRRKFYSE